MAEKLTKTEARQGENRRDQERVFLTSTVLAVGLMAIGVITFMALT